VSTETSHGDASGETSVTLTVARFEGRNRFRITAVLVAVFALYGVLFVWLGPELTAGEAVLDMVDALPAVLRELLGFESLASLEGLLASEYYTFAWTVGLGGYVAYTAAGSVAGDLSADRMDTVLAAPATRRDVLLGKYLALLVPIGVLNVVIPLLLAVAALLVADPLSLADLAALHLLSIPFLLTWGAIGLFLGVVVRRGRTAGRVGLGLVFFGWIFESVVSITDVAWLGAFSPMRYFDPPAILVDGTYDLVSAGVLLGVAVVFLALSTVAFERRDI